MKISRSVVASALCALGVAAVSPSVVAAPATARLIVAGHSVGQLHVGHDGSTQLQKMPRAQASDAGMSQNRLVWVSAKSHNTLFVHTVSNGALDVKPLQGVTITEINVTSPYFRTASGIGTGATLAQVRRAFPRVHRLASSETSGGGVIYDDARKGIAFEFLRASESARCIGITVYIAGNQPDAGHPVGVQSVKSLL